MSEFASLYSGHGNPQFLQGRVLLILKGDRVDLEKLQHGIVHNVTVHAAELLDPIISNSPPILGAYAGDLKLGDVPNVEIEVKQEDRSQMYLEDLRHVTITNPIVAEIMWDGTQDVVQVAGILYGSLLPDLEPATDQQALADELGVPPPIPTEPPPIPETRAPHAPVEHTRRATASKYGSPMDDAASALLVFVVLPGLLIATGGYPFYLALAIGIITVIIMALIVNAVMVRRRAKPKAGAGRMFFRTIYFLAAFTIALVLKNSGSGMFASLVLAGSMLLMFLLWVKWISPLVRAITNGMVALMLLLAGITAASIQANQEFDETWLEVYEDLETDAIEQTITINEGGNEYEQDVMVHYRSWSDRRGNDYRVGLVLVADDAMAATSYRENIHNSLANDAAWTRLYDDLYEQDKDALHFVYDSLHMIKEEYDLSRREFAEMVVTLVQQIPYWLIYPDNCKRAPRELKSEPCQGEVKFGVKTPTEFLYDLKGDCDTRTLLIYTILQEFGFDVVILGSTMYEHSMIGISMQGVAGGRYKKYKGTKYYTWETTYPDWEIGDISPDMGDMDYWVVDLPNRKN